LALLAIVVAVMVTFGFLGLWQLNVARDKGRAEQIRTAPSRAVADIAAVLAPHAAFPRDGDGRRVTARGRYDGSGQILVAPRRLGGASGYWVVTPLVVRSSGARIAVLRGFVTDPKQAVAPDASTDVTVSGTLAPGESSSGGSGQVGGSLGSTAPAGQLEALDLALLVNRWPGPMYNAVVFATGEQPDVTSSISPAVLRVPPPALAGGGLSWRNAAYALQWWVFALFAAFMWWRMVRDDFEDSRPGEVRSEHKNKKYNDGVPDPVGQPRKVTNV
jgi:cytochrome oxidase assembly protein ShyY1